jgi:hypothetical protein
MEKVFTYLPLLFGKKNILRDDKNQLFSVAIQSFKPHLFGKFIVHNLVYCHYDRGLIERSDRIYKSYSIDNLVLQGRNIYLDSQVDNVCYVSDVSLRDYFSTNTIFVGHCIFGSYVTSIGNLGVMLGREWKNVSEIILEKYKLFKCIMLKDVALGIIEILCLLGYYAKN